MVVEEMAAATEVGHAEAAETARAEQGEDSQVVVGVEEEAHQARGKACRCHRADHLQEAAAVASLVVQPRNQTQPSQQQRTRLSQ